MSEDGAQMDAHGLHNKAAQILSKKPLLHKTCLDNGIDVPHLDCVSHQFLLDVYNDKISVLPTSLVKYRAPKYNASAQDLLGKYLFETKHMCSAELVHSLEEAATTGVDLSEKD